MPKKYISENAKLMKEWDWEQNKDLDPNKLTIGSHTVAWWKCKLAHKYEMMVKLKTHGYGCPYCSNKRVLIGYNDLQTTHPQIAAEWHPTKNAPLTPTQVTYGSGKEVWWLCSKCKYEWSTKVEARTINHTGCPACANLVVWKGHNDLQTTHPQIAVEWHPTRNDHLTPAEVVAGSKRKVWWLCPIGHSYKAAICWRTRGTKCPQCDSGKHTSFAEQAIFFYVKKLYPDAISQYHADFLGKLELDIYIPSIRYAIEYDGKPWHNKKGALERDQKKYQLCNKMGIKLVRIQEQMSPLGSDVADWSLSTEKIHRYDRLEFIISQLLRKLDFSGKYFLRKFGINIIRDQFEIQKYKLSIREENSLEKLYPDIAKEWNYARNGDLTPRMFVPGSHQKVWWTCCICGYEYYMSIYHRTQRKQGCKKCGIEKRRNSQSTTVEMLDINTNEVIKTFPSIQEAARVLNIMPSNICMVCKGIRNKAGGYKWRYKK